MTRTLLTGNGAAAWGARLAEVEYLPAFPITPQTEIIETISRWIDQQEMDCRMVTLESEHSMVTAAGAAATTGVRVFSATSSQGLLYAMEMLYTVAGWRVPFVLMNISRGLSSPITLEPDHTDILALRDSGLLQLHCSTCQEVLDAVLLAYRLAEDRRVRLPVVVNLDGFYLSFTREPVAIPAPERVRRFLPPFDPENLFFSAGHPMSQAVAVLGGGPYSYFRYQSHLASRNALVVFDEISKEFNSLFGRHHSAMECYECEDAELVLLAIGSFATKAKQAVKRMREEGQTVGLVRPFMLRPFPDKFLRAVLSRKKGVAVFDQNLSMGKGGVLYMEVASALYGCAAPPVLVSFIGGLGGRDISLDEFREMIAVTRRAVEEGCAPEPRLLFSAAELREMRTLQTMAGVTTPAREGAGS